MALTALQSPVDESFERFRDATSSVWVSEAMRIIQERLVAAFAAEMECGVVVLLMRHRRLRCNLHAADRVRYGFSHLIAFHSECLSAIAAGPVRSP